MRLWTVCLILVLGCKKDKEVSTAVAPESCVAGTDVCAVFGAEWSVDNADELCADLGGESGECAEDELGTCYVEDDLQYRLYEMTKRDAEAYCEYLGGEWLDPGEELESEE